MFGRSSLWVLLAAFAASPILAQTDVVVTDAGDRLAGEIKSLDRGMLRFKTDATDTIEIRWSHVAGLSSQQNFFITLADGRELFGALDVPDDSEAQRLVTATGNVDLERNTIVRMTPIEGRLIDRIDMSVDLGYNITKANNVTQTNFGYNFGYRSEERLLTLALDAARSSSSDEPASHRNNVNVSYRRFRTDRHWDPGAIGNIERNDELGLNRRVTVGGGMSRWLTDTNSNRISFLGGLVATRENEVEALESDESIEAAIGISLDWFRYDDPELDVSMSLSVYERLSDTSRTRGNLDTDIRWELISDFFFGLKLYYTFNTEPLGEASRNDYGVVTTVGWSF
jgi:hypothetical protein